jgi:Tfp pilus assembly protein PilF
MAAASMKEAYATGDPVYYEKVLRIAAQELEEAISLGPVDKDAFNTLADVYQSAGRKEDAEKMRERAATAPVPR